MEKIKATNWNIEKKFVKCRNCKGIGKIIGSIVHKERLPNPQSKDKTISCPYCEGSGQFHNGYELTIYAEDDKVYKFFMDTLK